MLTINKQAKPKFVCSQYRNKSYIAPPYSAWTQVSGRSIDAPDSTMMIQKCNWDESKLVYRNTRYHTARMTADTNSPNQTKFVEDLSALGISHIYTLWIYIVTALRKGITYPFEWHTKTAAFEVDLIYTSNCCNRNQSDNDIGQTKAAHSNFV